MLCHVPGDLRLGVRRLLKTPAASATIIVALSAGIGLCALMFGIINGAILPTLPFENGERIVRVSPVSAETYRYWEERQRSFEALGTVATRTVNLAAEGRAAEPVGTAAMSLSTFSFLGVEPVLGRPFSDTDAAPGAPAVALIGEEIWRRRFDADPGVLGSLIRLSGEPAQVVGIMPEGFGFPWNEDVWTPQSVDAFRPGTNPGRFAAVTGVLREGVSIEAAEAELITLEAQRPRPAGEPATADIEVSPHTEIIYPAGLAELIAGILLVVSFLVLLVACANVTNVLLARAAARLREVAVRSSLGASRMRIAMQFWIEVSVLAFGGATGGCLLALFGAGLIRNIVGATEGLPFWWDLRVDLPVLAFIASAAAVAAIAAGVAPAVFASRSNSHELLKDASRTTSSRRLGRMMRRLIGAEMAVSLLLLVAAGLYIRSAVNLQTYDFSFEPDGVYTAAVTLPDGQYQSGAERAAFAGRLEAALSTMPEAQAAAVTTNLPGIGGVPRPIAVEGTHLASDSNLPLTRYVVTTPGFLDTFRVPVLAGRPFDTRDGADALPVAIVTATFERLHLPEGAVGRRIALPEETGEPVWLTIVGVVPDLLTGGLQSESHDSVYLPFAQAPPARFEIAVRSRTTADALARPIREAVADVDPDAALSYMRSLRDAINAANAAFAWVSSLFLVAGGLALALAAVGLYGVMAFWVTQRTREIGLRLAIGGGRGTIIGFVLRRGMTPVVLGLGCGLLASLPVAWLLRGSLLQVSPFDPIVFGTVLGVLLCAGWLGCLGPALKATRVDPQAALGAE